MQVAISRRNPARVAALPKTIAPNPRGEELDKDVEEHAKTSKVHSTRNPKGQLEELQQMLTAGLITQQDYEKKKDEILARM